MAERRMFSKEIVDSDAFIELPITAQALYFHLSMRADDDGFVNNPKAISRVIGASIEDLNLLISKGFLISFDGVVVIKHWRINNYIQNDRYHETKYTELKSKLYLKENRAYTTNKEHCIQSVSKMDTSCIQNVSKMDTENRIDKNRLDKNRDNARARPTYVKKYGKKNSFEDVNCLKHESNGFAEIVEAIEGG